MGCNSPLEADDFGTVTLPQLKLGRLKPPIYQPTQGHSDFQGGGLHCVVDDFKRRREGKARDDFSSPEVNKKHYGNTGNP